MLTSPHIPAMGAKGQQRMYIRRALSRGLQSNGTEIDCDDRNPCTMDELLCVDSERQCVHTNVTCKEGWSCDPADGLCKSDCDAIFEPSSCDDDNECTIDEMQVFNGEYICINTIAVTCNPGSRCDPIDGTCKVDELDLCVNVTCNPEFSCDPFDGTCKRDNELVPCVAVIDEDSSFGNGPEQQALWDEFRATYPSRPFCLLIVAEKADGTLTPPPPNFVNDTMVAIHYNVTRDYGNESLAMDWVTICGLEKYENTGTVDWVGLFVDNSGSMVETEVYASETLFNNTLAAMNMSVKKVANDEENWILPFMTELVPNTTAAPTLAPTTTVAPVPAAP